VWYQQDGHAEKKRMVWSAVDHRNITKMSFLVVVVIGGGGDSESMVVCMNVDDSDRVDCVGAAPPCDELSGTNGTTDSDSDTASAAGNRSQRSSPHEIIVEKSSGGPLSALHGGAQGVVCD
jgi:hypothetical protein